MWLFAVAYVFFYKYPVKVQKIGKNTLEQYTESNRIFTTSHHNEIERIADLTDVETESSTPRLRIRVISAWSEKFLGCPFKAEIKTKAKPSWHHLPDKTSCRCRWNRNGNAECAKTSRRQIADELQPQTCTTFPSHAKVSHCNKVKHSQQPCGNITCHNSGNDITSQQQQ